MPVLEQGGSLRRSAHGILCPRQALGSRVTGWLQLHKMERRQGLPCRINPSWPQRILRNQTLYQAEDATLNCKPKADMDDIGRGSNPTIYTFCTLILICLLLTSVTWHPKLKKPVTLETKGLTAKKDPTQSEQLTTVCSNSVGSFNTLDTFNVDALHWTGITLTIAIALVSLLFIGQSHALYSSYVFLSGQHQKVHGE